jgi:hypothetical protein
MVSDDIMILLTPRRERMKRAVILVLVLVAVILPVAGKTNLINIGYNVHGNVWNTEGLKLRSVSLNFINMKQDSAGFYSQITPYYGLSLKNVNVAKFSDYDEMVFGSNFLFGYGGDLNFGKMGLLLGGGLFLDMNYYNWDPGYLFTISTGLGLGANFYFQPGAGKFVVNAGLNLAWNPWAFQMWDGGDETYTNYKATNANFNIGIGWRTGGIGSKTAKSSSSGSGGGSDDW